MTSQWLLLFLCALLAHRRRGLDEPRYRRLVRALRRRGGGLSGGMSDVHDVTDPAVVASPTYGCRFTDQTAYTYPKVFPTRALFAPCATSG